MTAWHVHPVTPEKRYLSMIQDELNRGRVLILPTDTVYAFACSSEHPRAINELYKLKDLPETQPLSLLCRDVAMASEYARAIPNQVFRFMKAHTPGPYTFILPANRKVDRRGQSKKKTVGIRIVDHPLHIALMEALDTPLVSTSLTIEDEYYTDSVELERLYGKRVAAIIDGGMRYHEYSSVIDCADGLKLVRRGIGNVDELPIDEDLTDEG